MSRSLVVAPDQIERVKLAFQRSVYASQKALATELGKSPDTIRKFFSGRPIDRLNFIEICEALDLPWQDVIATELPPASSPAVASSARSPRISWGEAFDVSIFYGRTAELATLERWIVVDRCRLVAVLGMGGMGKSALSIKLGDRIQTDFDYLIWRSLREAPPVEKILADCIQILSDQQDLDISDTLGETITKLIHYLQLHRCLLVLDNAESILQGGVQAGQYRSGYAGYGTLLQQVGETQHQSCLLITSREKPKELARLEGNHRPVRVLLLRGLEDAAGREFLQAEGLADTDAGWKQVFDYYDGNPLALKIAANTIQDLFAGNIAQFLSQGTGVFGDIWELLDQQFERLSARGQCVMYWLAINREATSLADLKEDILEPTSAQQLLETLESLRRRCLIERSEEGFKLQNVVLEYIRGRFVTRAYEESTHGAQFFGQEATSLVDLEEDILAPISTQQLLETLESLRRRCLIERSEDGFTLQNVVMEYVTDRFVTRVSKELQTQQFNLFYTHALIKATSKNYVRETQVRLILNPVANHANTPEQYISNSLDIICQHPDWRTGYAAGNLLNLFCQSQHQANQYQVNQVDFSSLTLRQAHLQGMRLHGLNLANSRFIQPSLTQGFGSIQVVAFSPAGTLLAAGDSTGKIHLWQVSNQQYLATFSGHTDRVWSVAFSPDGQLLASGGDDATIRLWDIQQRQCLHVFSGHTNQVGSVAFRGYLKSSKYH